MTRFLVERHLGDIDVRQVEEAADNATRVREESYPGIGYEHSHVVRRDDGLTAYCVYRADDADEIREHSQAAGLPADRISVIEIDLEL